MKKSVIIFFMLLSAYCGGQTYSQKWADVNYVGDGQVYHNADIYLPKTVKASYPVVVYIYGSAWQSNNSKTSDMNTVGAALLDAGYAVVSINHRSSTDAKWPAQINDVKAAIRFVRGNAAKYKFDTCFVGISGSSSGGHLSSIAGVSCGVKKFTVGSTTMDIEGTLGNFKDCSSSVDAVCDWFGPMYLLKMDVCGNTTSHGDASSPGSLILGCAIKVCTDNAAMLEAKTYIDPTDPPFLIFHGTSDNVVPYCASTNLNTDLKAAGVQSEYVEVPGGQHYGGVHIASNFTKMVSFFNGVKDKTCSATPPSAIKVSVTAPASSATFEAPASVTLTADASTTAGSIAKVEFYQGTTKLGEDATSPYTYSWTGVAAGAYSITAVATDNAAAKATSAAVSITVTVQQSPYGGTAKPIPGTIQLEEYDEGGNGVAYNDGTAGSAVTPVVNYRTTEDVDVQTCTDAGAGYNLGYTTAGEWTEYTVNVAAAGTYTMTLRVACDGTGRTVSLSAKGVDVAKDIAVPSTGGWQTWQDVVVKDVKLDAGIQVLRLTIGATDYVNLNYISFTSTSVIPTPTVGIKLKAGWNMIGCPITGSTDIAKALASIWTQVDAVKNQDYFYSAANAAALNTLSKLDWSQGYMVKVKTACTLEWPAL